MKSNNQAELGFTLIELAVVVVLIGVFLAVLIVILNPDRQRERAYASVVSTTINRIMVEIKTTVNSDVTGNGDYPSCKKLISNLANVVMETAKCTGGYFGNGCF